MTLLLRGLVVLVFGGAAVASTAQVGTGEKKEITSIDQQSPRVLPLVQTLNANERLASFSDPAVAIHAANQAMALRLKQVELEIAQLELDRLQKQVFIEKGKKEDELRQVILGRQLFYHPVILAVVVILVLTGTLLVVWQFAAKTKSSKNSDASEFELGKEGMKLRSNFIGLLMLVASYAFFYLYILEVYRIRPLDAPTALQPK